MVRKGSGCTKITPRKISVLFVGDLNRGERLQEAVRLHDWNISIVTEIKSAPFEGENYYMPDLVILDGFPESEITRSAYYQLRSACYQFPFMHRILFLALSDSWNAMQFSSVAALSFIKIINRDPKPEDVVAEMVDLVNANKKVPPMHPPELISFDRKSFRCRLKNPCPLCHER